MTSLKKVENHPAVVRADFIRSLHEAIKRLFQPVARKAVVTITDDYIQIIMFPRKDELKWAGDEAIITDLEF